MRAEPENSSKRKERTFTHANVPNIYVKKIWNVLGEEKKRGRVHEDDNDGSRTWDTTRFWNFKVLKLLWWSSVEESLSCQTLDPPCYVMNNLLKERRYRSFTSWAVNAHWDCELGPRRSLGWQLQPVTLQEVDTSYVSINRDPLWGSRLIIPLGFQGLKKRRKGFWG